MTRRESLTVAFAGVLLFMVGMAWAFGPLALILAGPVLLAVALLTTERERGEPSDKTAPPPA